MDKLLQVLKLNKSYANNNFSIENLCIYVNKGSIVGFIGENGSGKSTTINTIIGNRKKNSGSISFFNKDVVFKDYEYKQDISVVFDDMKLPSNLNVVQLNKVFGYIYENWNVKHFFSYINKFKLPKKEKVKNFSRGMSMKLSLAVALSHESKLLILDEATAGIDVTGREDISKILADFTEQKNGGVLISSHIAEEINHLADYLLFIKNGKVIFEIEKEKLFNNYYIFECNSKEFEKNKNNINSIAYRKKGNFYEFLIYGEEGLSNYDYQKVNSIDQVSKVFIRGDIL